MQPDAYDRLTERLREGLSADARVLGLVALGAHAEVRFAPGRGVGGGG